jgi:hypothetical protein
LYFQAQDINRLRIRDVIRESKIIYRSKGKAATTRQLIACSAFNCYPGKFRYLLAVSGAGGRAHALQLQSRSTAFLGEIQCGYLYFFQCADSGFSIHTEFILSTI